MLQLFGQRCAEICVRRYGYNCRRSSGLVERGGSGSFAATVFIYYCIRREFEERARGNKNFFKSKKMRPEPRFILIVSLWLKSGKISDFEAYERRAARILKKHGGRIERAVRVKKRSSETDAPFEIHVVSFPNERNFAKYQTDAETLEIAASRNDSIARTEIISGFETYDYHETEY